MFATRAIAVAAFLSFALGTAAAQSVTSFDITPADGVLSSDTAAADGTLSIRFLANVVGNLKIESSELKDDFTARSFSYTSAGTEATFSVASSAFKIQNAGIDVNFTFAPNDASDTTSQTVTSLRIVVDAIAPEPPGAQSVIASNESLIVSWDIGNYDTAPTQARNNIETFRIYYASAPLNEVLTFEEDIENSLAIVAAEQLDDRLNVAVVDFTDNHVLTGLANDITYYVAVEAVDPAGNRSGLRTDAAGTIVAATATPIQTTGFNEANGIDDRCFIATAAFGDAESAWVDAYRFFRDRFLLQLPGGDWLVSTYYAVSPAAAAWLSDHDDARLAVRLLLQFAAPIALLLGGLGPVFAVLGLVFVFARRQKATALALAFFAMLPTPTLADDWHYEQSFSLLTTRYRPDDAGRGSAISYADVYGDFGTYLIQAEYAWYPLTVGGKLGVGARFGFGRDKGNSVIASTGAPSAESSKFWFLPASILARYRGEWFNSQPLVPAVHVGFDGWGLHEKRRAQKDGTQNFVLGWHAGAELELVLDWMDKQAAARLEENYGIRATSLYGGYDYVKLDDFGAVKSADFSHHNWSAGLRFIF